MCFGGKGGGGGNQGGGSNQEDAEIRRSHSKAGISAAETRRHFRERDNPAHSRNENAAGATKSVSHSRDEGGNLVAKRVEYGQGSFAPPQGEREGRMKAENILGKRNDVRQIGNDLDIGGTIFKNAKLSKSGNSILSTNPDSIGTMGGITSNGGLWGGNKIKSVLGVTDGVGAVNSRGIATSLITPSLDNQRRSRTAKYQAQSDLFKNSTPEQIEAIRAANRAKNPADQDGDGSWLTSTDNMGRVAGIGTTFNPDGSLKGDGAQPYIFDPTLGKEYQALPQLDPNRGADTNLTMFGKGMRTAGKAVAGALVPGAGALMLLDRFSDKIPSFLTGGDALGSANDKALLRQEEQRSAFPVPTSTRFATSDQNAPNPFSETSSASTSGSALSGFRSPYPQKRPIGALSSTPKGMTNYEDRNLSSFSPIPLDQRITGDVSDAYLFRNYNPPIDEMMPPSTTGSLDPTRGDRIRFRRNNQQYIDMGARGEPMDITIPEAGSSPSSRFVDYAFNESGSDDNNSYSDGVPIQPVIAPSADYAQWMPNSGYIGASSYGGPFSSASQNFASVLPPSIYSTGGSSNSVPTRFVNDRTKQYFTAPNDSYYAEENSDWRQANPYSLA
jgi:hypothetical protein